MIEKTGKNKRKQIEYFDEFHNIKLMVDSNEEVDTLDWLIEAQKYGIIIDWEYQPESIKLFDSVDYINSQKKKRCLFREHVYSADFKITFNPSKFTQLSDEFKINFDNCSKEKIDVLIDVKGTFSRTERAFGLNQKWVYQLTKKYIYKLIPKMFFKKFGCPKKCFITRKTNKSRKLFQGYKSIEQCFK